MTRNKNQHWVPQSYLEAWVDPNTPAGQKGYVHLFNRDGGNHRRKAPENIMVMRDLYTVFDGSNRDLRIEDTFAAWEGKFVKARRTIETHEFGTNEEAGDLYVFTGAMMARPPHRIKFFADQWASIVNKARTIRINPNVPPMRSINKGPSMSLDEAQKLADDPMGTWFPGEVAANINVLAERFGCDVLINVSEHPFLTSDAPAVVHFPPKPPPYRNMPRGLGSPGCEITLPISPRTALLFRHKAPGIHAFLNADWERVFEVNFRTITRARQRIVSDRHDIFFVRAITEKVAEVDGRAS